MANVFLFSDDFSVASKKSEKRFNETLLSPPGLPNFSYLGILGADSNPKFLKNKANGHK